MLSAGRGKGNRHGVPCSALGVYLGFGRRLAVFNSRRWHGCTSRVGADPTTPNALFESHTRADRGRGGRPPSRYTRRGGNCPPFVLLARCAAYTPCPRRTPQRSVTLPLPRGACPRSARRSVQPPAYVHLRAQRPLRWCTRPARDSRSRRLGVDDAATDKQRLQVDRADEAEPLRHSNAGVERGAGVDGVDVGGPAASEAALGLGAAPLGGVGGAADAELMALEQVAREAVELRDAVEERLHGHRAEVGAFKPCSRAR